MRTVLTVAGNQLVRFFADRQGALLMFAIPLAFNLVLGVSLRQAFSPEFRPDRPYRVALAAPGAHPAAAALDQVLASAAADGWVEVTRAADASAALRAVQRREAEAAVILPDAFPREPLRVVAEPGTVAGAMVESVVREAAAAVTAAGTAAVPVDLALRPAGGDGAGRPATDAMGYYAAGMSVMMVYFAARSGTQSYLRDRATGVYLRVRAAGVSSRAYLAGKFAGSVAVAVAFLALMALATRVLFGVRWGDPGGWAVLSAAAAVAAAGVNAALLGLVRSPEAMEGVGTALAQVLAFFGGSMMPVFVFPEALARISRLVPNRWMLDGYLELMGGAGAAAVVDEAARLALAGLAMLAVGWLVDSLAARTAGEA